MTRDECKRKLHAIQTAALNEIRDILTTRAFDFLTENEVRAMVSDITAVAEFGSQVDLTNPHYDGHAIVAQMGYDPARSILWHAKHAVPKIVVSAKEQKLVDACFELAIVSARGNGDKSQEEIAAWTASNLRALGFDTAPMGSSHGVLKAVSDK